MGECLQPSLITLKKQNAWQAEKADVFPDGLWTPWDKEAESRDSPGATEGICWCILRIISSSHSKGGQGMLCLHPSPGNSMPTPGTPPYIYAGNTSCQAVLYSSALFLPECLPAPLRHTHSAPSPAFRVLAAKSMGVLRRQLNPTGLCTGQLWGNLGQLSYAHCASFLDLISISCL